MVDSPFGKSGSFSAKDFMRRKLEAARGKNTPQPVEPPEDTVKVAQTFEPDQPTTAPPIVAPVDATDSVGDAEPKRQVTERPFGKTDDEIPVVRVDKVTIEEVPAVGLDGNLEVPPPRPLTDSEILELGTLVLKGDPTALEAISERLADGLEPASPFETDDLETYLRDDEPLLDDGTELILDEPPRNAEDTEYLEPQKPIERDEEPTPEIPDQPVEDERTRARKRELIGKLKSGNPTEAINAAIQLKEMTTDAAEILVIGNPVATTIINGRLEHDELVEYASRSDEHREAVLYAYAQHVGSEYLTVPGIVEAITNARENETATRLWRAKVILGLGTDADQALLSHDQLKYILEELEDTTSRAVTLRAMEAIEKLATTDDFFILDEVLKRGFADREYSQIKREFLEGRLASIEPPINVGLYEASNDEFELNIGIGGMIYYRRNAIFDSIIFNEPIANEEETPILLRHSERIVEAVKANPKFSELRAKRLDTIISEELNVLERPRTTDEILSATVNIRKVLTLVGKLEPDAPKPTITITDIRGRLSALREKDYGYTAMTVLGYAPDGGKTSVGDMDRWVSGLATYATKGTKEAELVTTAMKVYMGKDPTDSITRADVASLFVAKLWGSYIVNANWVTALSGITSGKTAETAVAKREREIKALNTELATLLESTDNENMQPRTLRVANGRIKEIVSDLHTKYGEYTSIGSIIIKEDATLRPAWALMQIQIFGIPRNADVYNKDFVQNLIDFADKSDTHKETMAKIIGTELGQKYATNPNSDEILGEFARRIQLKSTRDLGNLFRRNFGLVEDIEIGFAGERTDPIELSPGPLGPRTAIDYGIELTPDPTKAKPRGMFDILDDIDHRNLVERTGTGRTLRVVTSPHDAETQILIGAGGGRETRIIEIPKDDIPKDASLTFEKKVGVALKWNGGPAIIFPAKEFLAAIKGMVDDKDPVAERLSAILRTAKTPTPRIEAEIEKIVTRTMTLLDQRGASGQKTYEKLINKLEISKEIGIYSKWLIAGAAATVAMVVGVVAYLVLTSPPSTNEPEQETKAPIVQVQKPVPKQVGSAPTIEARGAEENIGRFGRRKIETAPPITTEQLAPPQPKIPEPQPEPPVIPVIEPPTPEVPKPVEVTPPQPDKEVKEIVKEKPPTIKPPRKKIDCSTSWTPDKEAYCRKRLEKQLKLR